MITSDQVNEIAAALAKAQAAMGGAVKDSANPFFKSKYADLSSVREACNGPLTANGIAVVQSPSTSGAVVSVVTMLIHVSGQWLRGEVSCTAKDDSPQAVGSAITYLRRYALQSFAGVAPEDDDAEAAQGRTTERVPTSSRHEPERQPPPRPALSSEVTVKNITTKQGNKNGNPWVLYIVAFSDGREGTTFDAKIAKAATDARDAYRPVEPVLEPGRMAGKFDLVGFDSTDADARAREPLDDVIPF